MRSNEIKKKPRGKSKSCGADFYDMPELERLPNPCKNDLSRVRKF